KCERHAFEHQGIQCHGDVRIRAATGEVFRYGGRGEVDDDHKEEEQEIEEEQGPVDDADVRHHHVVVDPDDADGEEADQVGDECRPVLTELLQQGTVAGSADRQVQCQQRDGHRKHAIAKRLQPASIHRAFYLSRDPRIGRGSVTTTPPARRYARLTVRTTFPVFCSVSTYLVASTTCSSG